MPILGAAAVPHPPLIMPEVGQGREQEISATVAAYRESMRRLAALDPELVIITSPHATMYADYFHVSPGRDAMGSFNAFGAPQLEIDVQYDAEFVAALDKACKAIDFPAGTLGEREPRLDHATLIPLRFLRDAYAELGITPRYKAVRIGISGLPTAQHYKLGQILAQLTDDLPRRAVFIASGDLSHKLKKSGPYGFNANGPKFDSECMAALGDGDFLRLLSIDHDVAEGAAECGLRSFWIMAGALDKKAVAAEQLSYEGTFGVGYGIAYFAVGGDDAARDFGEQFKSGTKARLARRKAAEDDYVKLARRSVEKFVRTGRASDVPNDVPPELARLKSATFVTLKKDGELRGCIGTFRPSYANLAEEIWSNAIAACSQDPRFSPVREDELNDIVYSVDVLTEPEPVASEAELDPKKYGVIVSCGGRRGLLLPDLAGVDTVEEQVAIARKKGNIGPNEKITLQRFTVIRHH